MKDQEILIIGQGLTGTILSYLLYKQGIEHKVLDNNHKNAATLAAAGIINPITGRRYVKSWMIDSLIPAAKLFYGDIQDFLKIDILRETSIIRALNNPGQEHNWINSIDRPDYDVYAEENGSLRGYQDFVREKDSYGIIKQALQVDIAKMICSYKDFLNSTGNLITGEFDFNVIDLDQPTIKFEEFNFKKVVFCEGYRVIENPLFNHIPFEHSKGESFTLQIDGLETREILRDDIFLVPLGKNQFWCGGGYEWIYENDQPTLRFKKSWTAKIDDLLKVPYKMSDQKAGIRSTVVDRRPILGNHPDFNNIYLFNGMGTKGTSLSPYWAEKLLEFMLEGKPLDKEVDVNRFERKEKA